MRNKVKRPGRAVREIHALAQTVGRYWLTVFPVARAELRLCQARAEAIPDPVLHRYALTTLAEEQANAEGAAIFATLAPRRHRATVTRLLVRYQVIYDYLDTLTEQSVADPLANGRQLHLALTAALGDDCPVEGYYLHHPQTDDGGYLSGLVNECRRVFRGLPGASAVAPTVHRAARRSAEAQSHNHAAMLAHDDTLQRWATQATPVGSLLHWWEIAAAAGSSLSIHALLACAARVPMTPQEAERIDAVYWPWINGLNTLLESLTDAAIDATTENHSFVSHYASPQEMTARLTVIARHAAHMVRRVPNGREHAMILAAMASFYLASLQSGMSGAGSLLHGVRAELATDVRLLLAMLRMRRRFAGGRRVSVDHAGTASSERHR